MATSYSKIIPLLLGSAVALTGCGGGGSSSDSDSSASSNSAAGADVTAKYGDVRYDLAKAFNDYRQAVAKMSTSTLNYGVVYNDRQKLLIDKNGELIDFTLQAEPTDAGSRCKLKPVKVTLDHDLDSFELEKIADKDELYLIKMKGLPAKFNEATCEYQEGKKTELQTYLVNKNGESLAVDLELANTISFNDKEHNRLGKTVVVATNGNVYALELDKTSEQPMITKLAETGRTDWKYVSTDVLATEHYEQRFRIYDYKLGRNYNVITNNRIKSQGIDTNSNIYYETYDDTFVSLKVDSQNDKLTETPINKATAIGVVQTKLYQQQPECKVKNVKDGSTFTIYESKDVSLFNDTPQELKSELHEIQSDKWVFTCRSDNGRYLAVRDLTGTSLQYGVVDFGMKVLFRQPTTQLIAGSFYTMAGDDSYSYDKHAIYKLDIEAGTFTDLSTKYDLKDNQWVSSIQAVNQ